MKLITYKIVGITGSKGFQLAAGNILPTDLTRRSESILQFCKQHFSTDVLINSIKYFGFGTIVGSLIFLTLYLRLFSIAWKAVYNLRDSRKYSDIFDKLFSCAFTVKKFSPSFNILANLDYFFTEVVLKRLYVRFFVFRLLLLSDAYYSMTEDYIRGPGDTYFFAWLQARPVSLPGAKHSIEVVVPSYFSENNGVFSGGHSDVEEGSVNEFIDKCGESADLVELTPQILSFVNNLSSAEVLQLLCGRAGVEVKRSVIDVLSEEGNNCKVEIYYPVLASNKKVSKLGTFLVNRQYSIFNYFKEFDVTQLNMEEEVPQNVGRKPFSPVKRLVEGIAAGWGFGGGDDPNRRKPPRRGGDSQDSNRAAETLQRYYSEEIAATLDEYCVKKLQYTAGLAHQEAAQQLYTRAYGALMQKAGVDYTALLSRQTAEAATLFDEHSRDVLVYRRSGRVDEGLEDNMRAEQANAKNDLRAKHESEKRQFEECLITAVKYMRARTLVSKVIAYNNTIDALDSPRGEFAAASAELAAESVLWRRTRGSQQVPAFFPKFVCNVLMLDDILPNPKRLLNKVKLENYKEEFAGNLHRFKPYFMESYRFFDIFKRAAAHARNSLRHEDTEAGQPSPLSNTFTEMFGPFVWEAPAPTYTVDYTFMEAFNRRFGPGAAGFNRNGEPIATSATDGPELRAARNLRDRLKKKKEEEERFLRSKREFERSSIFDFLKAKKTTTLVDINDIDIEEARRSAPAEQRGVLDVKPSLVKLQKNKKGVWMPPVPNFILDSFSRKMQYQVANEEDDNVRLLYSEPAVFDENTQTWYFKSVRKKEELRKATRARLENLHTAFSYKNAAKSLGIDWFNNFKMAYLPTFGLASSFLRIKPKSVLTERNAKQEVDWSTPQSRTARKAVMGVRREIFKETGHFGLNLLTKASEEAFFSNAKSDFVGHSDSSMPVESSLPSSVHQSTQNELLVGKQVKKKKNKRNVYSSLSDSLGGSSRGAESIRYAQGVPGFAESSAYKKKAFKELRLISTGSENGHAPNSEKRTGSKASLLLGGPLILGSLSRNIKNIATSVGGSVAAGKIRGDITLKAAAVGKHGELQYYGGLHTNQAAMNRSRAFFDVGVSSSALRAVPEHSKVKPNLKYFINDPALMGAVLGANPADRRVLLRARAVLPFTSLRAMLKKIIFTGCCG